MTSMTANSTPLRVLFDGGCLLCRREIAHYRRLQPRRAVEWIDIDAAPEQPLPLGLSREQAMARFHVLEGERIETGAAAFVLLWRALPGWRWLAYLVQTLRLIGLMERGYLWFARRRLRQRCADGVCASGD